jgi:hypothetical protein
MQNYTIEPIDTGKARHLLDQVDIDPDHEKKIINILHKRRLTHGSTQYRYAEGRGDGRRYGNTASAQNLKSELRAEIGSQLFDLDLDCSHPSMIIDACRFNDIKIPPILYEMVTKRMEIRKDLSVYYFGTETPKGIQFGKSLVNAFLYGQSLYSAECFEKAGLQFTQHHPKLIKFKETMDSLVSKLQQIPSNSGEKNFCNPPVFCNPPRIYNPPPPSNPPGELRGRKAT